MGRKKDRKEAQQEMAERAHEIREKAKVMADEGGEAFKDFAGTTRVAAKDFATTAFEAAKQMLETVEQAGERFEKQAQPKRRGRKLLKAGIALGAGAALFANESFRNLVAQKLGFGGGEPEPWETPAATSGNGEFTQPPVSQTTP